MKQSPPQKGILCRYDIRIQTVSCVCACSWENQLQVLGNTKRSSNRSCSLNQHDYHLKSEHMQLKSLLTFFKAQAFITFSYRSFSYFFPNKMLLLTVPENTQGCWETYAIFPCTLTCPWLRGSSPSTALNSEDWNRRQHTREQAALRTEHAPQHSWPHPGAWHRIEPFHLEQDKVQFWQLRGGGG